MLFGLFQPPPHALRVVETSGGVVSVPEVQRLHPSQRVQRTWTIAAGAGRDTNDALTKLSLQCPGLTIVRMNSDLQQRHDHDRSGAVAAVVRVTSDAARHIGAVRIALKRRRSELRVLFKKSRHGNDKTDVGALVVEIELAPGVSIDELFAKAGGDVVVSRGVLARCRSACDSTTCGVGVIAFDRGRLFVDETASASEDAATGFCELGVGSLYGGRVYLSASHLQVRELLGSSVVGNGSVHVHAERITTKHVKVGAIGNAGSATLSVADALQVDEMEAFVWGSALVAVDATRGGGIACQKLALQVEGRGAIDASDVRVSQSSDVRIRGNGHVALLAPDCPDAALTLDCDVCATVKCIGGAWTALRDAECRVIYANGKTRVSSARPCPPSIESAFETPKKVCAQRAGFCERHVRPLLGFH